MDSINKAHMLEDENKFNQPALGAPHKGTSTAEGFVPSPPTSQPPSAGIHLKPELSEGSVPSSSTVQEPNITGLHSSSELQANPAKNTLKDNFQTSGSSTLDEGKSLTGSALSDSSSLGGSTLSGKSDTAKAASIKSGIDVVHFLKDQHNLIETMFEKVFSAPSKETRQTAFTDLRRLLAVHEAAEEIVVHPRCRKIVGDKVVDARLKEEAEAKMKLVKLESMDIGSRAFMDELRSFAEAVKDHAKHEEEEEFEYLLRELDTKELQRMQRSVEIAESLAPTRPHPMAGEGATLNLMVGPFASMVDRARDAFNL